MSFDEALSQSVVPKPKNGIKRKKRDAEEEVTAKEVAKSQSSLRRIDDDYEVEVRLQYSWRFI